jgi:hypothetical protein
MKKSKIVLLLLVVLALGLFFAFDLGRYFSLDHVKSVQSDIARLYADRPAFVIGGFFAVYVAVAALSLPGAAVTLLAARCSACGWLGVV